MRRAVGASRSVRFRRARAAGVGGAHQVGCPDESEMGPAGGGVRAATSDRAVSHGRPPPRATTSPPPRTGPRARRSRELIPARARRRQKDGVARRGGGRRHPARPPRSTRRWPWEPTLEHARPHPRPTRRSRSRPGGAAAWALSGERSTPFARPPAIRTASPRRSIAAAAAWTFVAFELSTNRTPSTVATTSPRWGPGRNRGERGRRGGGRHPVGERDAPPRRPRPRDTRPRAVDRARADGRRPSWRRARRPRSRPRPRRRPFRNQRSAHVALEEISAATRSSRLPMCTSVPAAARRCALRLDVGLERAVPVEVIGRDVQQDRDRRDGTTPGARAGSSTPPRRARRVPRAPPPGRTGRCCRTRARRARRLADRPRSSTSTVVLPFVPVTARYGARASRAPSSISPQTGRPRSRAHRRTSASGGTPGPVTTSVAASRWLRIVPPARTSTPRGSELRGRGQVRLGSRLRHEDAGALGRQRARRARPGDPRADDDRPLPREPPAHPRPPRAMKSA